MRKTAIVLGLQLVLVMLATACGDDEAAAERAECRDYIAASQSCFVQIENDELAMYSPAGCLRECTIDVALQPCVPERKNDLSSDWAEAVELGCDVFMDSLPNPLLPGGAYETCNNDDDVDRAYELARYTCYRRGAGDLGYPYDGPSCPDLEDPFFDALGGWGAVGGSSLDLAIELAAECD